MRKLLMLGGSDVQLPAIHRAKALGFHVITCGNKPTDAGHAFADEYHDVSTVDKERVLALANDLRIDGISAYGSDPAAITAAYVAERLGLPGSGHEAVIRLQDKVLFREDQHALGIPAPGAAEALSAEQVLGLVKDWPSGGILKPVDTSGSKGVFRMDARTPLGVVQEMFEEALGFSRSKKLVIEEFLVRSHPQMTGDVLIDEGRIKFFCFGDVHFNTAINGLVPRSVSYPTVVPMELQERAVSDAQRLIDHLGVRVGVFNIDIMVDDRGRSVMIDIGARNGGNLVSELMFRRTGVDLAEVCIRQSMGLPIDLGGRHAPAGYFAHMVVHSSVDGTLRAIRLSPELKGHVFHEGIIAGPGDRVRRFTNSANRLGLLLTTFPDHQTMLRVIAEADHHIEVEVTA